MLNWGIPSQVAFRFNATSGSLGFWRIGPSNCLNYSLSPGFWQSFISMEVCRDCIPALASSCKKQLINGFLNLLIVFLKSKTYQLILKDMIKLNRNLW